MKNILVLLLIVIPLQLFSQPFFDLLNLKYQYFQAQYFKNGDRKIAAREFNGNLMVPLIQKDSNTILAGGFYKRINSNDELHPFSLYSSGLYLGYDVKWKNKKWSTTGIFIPKISSDDFTFNRRNFQIGGVVLFKFKYSPSLQYNFGLYYNRELFGNYFVPLIGIDWKASDRIRLFGNLPSSFTLEYKINSIFYSGVNYSSFTGSFALHANDNLYIREGDKHIGYTQLRLFLNWYIKEKFVLFLEPGYTYKRIYAIYNSSDEKIFFDTSLSESKTRDGYFVQAGIAFRIRFDN